MVWIAHSYIDEEPHNMIPSEENKQGESQKELNFQSKKNRKQEYIISMLQTSNKFSFPYIN